MTDKNLSDESYARRITHYNRAISYQRMLDIVDEISDDQLANMVITLRDCGSSLPEAVTDINRCIAILRAAMHRT